MSTEAIVKPRAQKKRFFLSSYFLWKALFSIDENIISFPSTPHKACCEGCCCQGCYNWPTTLTFRIILLLADFSYFVMNAIQAGYSCDRSYRYYCGFDVTCTLLFMSAFGIGIVMIIAFSKFPKDGCCDYNNTYPTQTVVVGGQAQPMQTVQRMPNGQLMVIQNPSVGINNPNYVIAQQPQMIQAPAQIIQQPAVVQQHPKQNETVVEAPPSYENL